MTTMDKGFEFIDGTRCDRFTRRVARSHAMKGKNVGRKLNRRSRLGIGRLPTTKPKAALHDPKRSLPDRVVSGGSNTVVRASLGKLSEPKSSDLLSERLLPETLPFDVSAQSRYVIKEFLDVTFEALFPPQLCRSLDKAKSYGMRILFMDRTSYHCSIALMASVSAFFLGRKSLPTEAIYHLNQAVRLVNAKITTSDALSDSVISVVNLLVLQGLIREDQSHAKTHLDGLRKMVELRGGLGQLLQNEPLLVKICKTELDYALHYGTAAYFYRDRMAEVALALAPEGFYLHRTCFPSPSRFNTMDPALQQILLDVTNICQLFNMKHVSFGLEPHLFQEIVVSFGGRLNRFHQLQNLPLPSSLESVYHIGLTAFVTTLFLQCGRRRLIRYVLVAQCVKKAIERGVDEEHNDVLLWLLFIGGISGLNELCGRDWLVSRIQRVAQSLEIDDWATLRKLLGRFPWIGCLHDVAGKALWGSVVEELQRS